MSPLHLRPRLATARPCLSDDEAIYAVVAREMLAGRTPYAEVVNHKPPRIFNDFQPKSCGYGATYGLEPFRGEATVVTLLAAW